MQGDVFRDIPLSHLLPNPDHHQPVAALMLTPTCDFALKGEHPERHIVAAEPLPRHSGDSKSATPRHILLLPALSGLLPYGGFLNFRRVVTIHNDVLESRKRAATLNADGLRTLLAAQTTYYTRSSVDPAAISLMPDDPRPLWQAIDCANGLPGFASQRAALEEATTLAIRALLYYHGLKTDSPAQALVLLEYCAQHEVFPPTSVEATHLLTEAQSTLKALYAVTPAELPRQRRAFDRLNANLEEIALVLQEPRPLQITATLLREKGLGNILPR